MRSMDAIKSGVMTDELDNLIHEHTQDKKMTDRRN